MRMGRDIGDDDASYDPKADERAVAAAHRDERPRAELTLEQLFECVRDPVAWLTLQAPPYRARARRGLQDASDWPGGA